jgi:trimeric autotransporter adhesin
MAFAKYPVDGGGGGGISGPVTTTNNAVVLWDGTDGSTVKDSGIVSSTLVLTSGNQSIGGSKTFTSEVSTPSVALTATSNQMSFGAGPNKITVNVPNNPASNLTYSMPNIAAVSATGTFSLLEAANQTFSGTGTIFSQTVRFDATTPLFLGASPNRIVLSPGTQASARTWLFPDLSTDPTFAALEGAQTFTGNKTFNGTNTFGGASTFSSVLRANGNIYLNPAGNHTEIIALASGGNRTYTIPNVGGTANFAMTEGTQTINGAKTLGSALTISPTSNQLVLGVTNTTTISATAPAASRTYTLPDAGGAADFVLTAGSQTLTSKTLTSPIIGSFFDSPHAATPASPSAGTLRIYSKSDDRLYRITSGGVEQPIGSGLDPVERSTALNPAVAGTLYLCNTTSAGFTITLPSGTAKASIGFLDARETFATNNLTIAPATGQAIDGYAVNETLVMDVSGSWVILTWDSVNSRWVVQSSAPGSSNQAIVQGGNTLGAAMTIGTNDNFGVNIETNGTTKLSVGTAGDVTAGPAGSSGSTTQPLNVYGGINGIATGTGDGSKLLILNANTFATGQTVRGTRNSASNTLGGAALLIAARTNDTLNAFQFETNLTANGDTTSVTQIASATQAGAWTWGPPSFNGGHTVNGTLNVTRNISNTFIGLFENSNATASSTNPIVVSRYSGDSDVTGGYFFACQNSSLSIVGRIEAASNTTTTFTGSSDARLKQNPTTFSGLDKVLAMQPREFEWKSNPGKRDKGFYAQELQEVYPEAVSIGTDELTESGDLKVPWGIDYGRLTPVLVRAIQELHAEIQTLKGA